jgi:hypothetical protein
MPAIRRRPGIASVAALAGITLALGLAHLAAPEWVRAAGLDVWNAAAARADLARSLACGDEIDTRSRHMLDQIRASDGVAARLAAGRLTLAAAADELAALNAGRPGWEDGLRVRCPDAPTPRHRVARYAIIKVGYWHRAESSGWAQLSARLEADYLALGGGGGTGRPGQVP